jgi:hypothetical protein
MLPLVTHRRVFSSGFRGLYRLYARTWPAVPFVGERNGDFASTGPAAGNPFPNYLVRTHGDPMAIAQTIHRRIHQLEPNRSVYGISLLQEHIDDVSSESRLRTLLLTLLAQKRTASSWSSSLWWPRSHRLFPRAALLESNSCRYFVRSSFLVASQMMRTGRHPSVP